MESITVHTFGDSHANGLHSHWGRISLPNIIIKTNDIGGRLMYTFGKQKFDVLNIKNYDVKEGDIVIFCFGEIDCRNHVHKHITEDLSFQQIIDNLVHYYFEAIEQNVKQYTNITTCVYNVVPPIPKMTLDEGHTFPFLGTDNERKLYTEYMNKKIKEFCEKFNYFYFDIYHESSNEEKFLRYELSDRGVHLKKSEYSPVVLKNLIDKVKSKQ